MKPESNRPVAIEDLLRLKRAERPPAEFWGEFDRQLRSKQLAALVAKRPWWQRLPRLVPTLARYRIVLGGTAVAAMAFVTLQEEAPSTPALIVESVAMSEPVVAAPVVLAGVGVSYPEVDEFVPAVKATETVAVAIPDAPRVAEVAVDAQVAAPLMPDNLSRLVALGGGTVAVSDAAAPTSAVRPVAATLASVQVGDQAVMSRLLGGTHGFEARAMPARTTVDPLQQMTPPGESRRARLLTAMVSMAALETSARTTERAANRLAEERVFDQDGRFGARGDRVHMKF
ncbi:MAG: hypothetical protein JNL92_09195 [Opitutaceae bacterium]|nr:hypothetical protein [Opitutaceae bacterium]